MPKKIKARFMDYLKMDGYDENDPWTWGNPVKSTVKPGTEFYLINVTSTKGFGKPRSFSIGQPHPGRTNMSGEKRVNGWLGCTDDVDRSADGRWVVRKVLKVSGRDQEWVTVLADRIE